MKKLAALLMSLTLAIGLLAGCSTPASSGTASSGSEASTTPTSSTGGTPAVDNGFNKENKDIGIVMIVNTNLGDKSFCDLSNDGLMRIAADYGARIKVVELNGDATKQVPSMIEFAEDPDWDIIIGGTYNILESMQTVAQEFPNQKFILYDAKDALELPNIYAVEHMQNEGSFIVGAAAALLTTTGELANDQKVIGFVGGSENTAINDFLIGFIQGAQYIDPDCKVLVSYIGDFKDSARGKEMAIAQINQGADVVFGVAGGAGLGVLDACLEKNVYAIGVDADQAIVLEADGKTELASHIATSMMKMVDNTVYNALASALEGTLVWGAYETAGLSMGSVGAAKNKFYEAIFTAEQRAKIDEVEADVASGEIKVETAVGMDSARVSEIKDSARP